MDLEKAEPLVCPTCWRTIGVDDLAADLCHNCQKQLVGERAVASMMRRGLSVVVALVVVAILAVLVVGGFGGLSIFGALISALSGEDKPSILAAFLVMAVACGLFSLIFATGLRVIAYFSAKGARPQLTVAKIARRYLKSGDLQKAARFYAELLTYGFSENFYVNTGRAYGCWKKLGSKAELLPFSAPFRDLLFYERLIRHAEMRGRGSDKEWGSAALDHLREMVGLASRSDRLLSLAKIYHKDRRFSQVAPALKGTLHWTNSVSGAEETMAMPKELEGEVYPMLSDAFR
jgi:hypothetical protein